MSSNSEIRVLMARVMVARGIGDPVLHEQADGPPFGQPTLLQRIARLDAPGGFILPFRNLKELHR